MLTQIHYKVTGRHICRCSVPFISKLFPAILLLTRVLLDHVIACVERLYRTLLEKFNALELRLQVIDSIS